MSKQILIYILMAITTSLFLNSCSKDHIGVSFDQTNPGVLHVNFVGEELQQIQQVSLSWMELNTGKEDSLSTTQVPVSIRLPIGSYNLKVSGVATLNNQAKVSIAGSSKFDITSDATHQDIEVYAKSFTDDFLIEEVFFSGVKTLQGKIYNSGKYFKIVNNTDKTLSTAGLMLVISEFSSIIDNRVTPDIRANGLAIKNALLILDKDAKEIESGDFIVIADMAYNHKTPDIPAFDLTLADYEYPNLDNPALGQVNNPLVANAQVVYSQLNFNMFLTNNRGTESYALVRLPEQMNIEQWIEQYKYAYSYTNILGNQINKIALYVENDWILDGVNSTEQASWLQDPLGPSIDAGHTGIGVMPSDPNRYGKSIRRKIIGRIGKGNLYQDTNNSSEDFVSNSIPSLQNGIEHE